jgi:hypothetical protein
MSLATYLASLNIKLLNLTKVAAMCNLYNRLDVFFILKGFNAHQDIIVYVVDKSIVKMYLTFLDLLASIPTLQAVTR